MGAVLLFPVFYISKEMKKRRKPNHLSVYTTDIQISEEVMDRWEKFCEDMGLENTYDLLDSFLNDYGRRLYQKRALKPKEIKRRKHRIHTFAYVLAAIHNEAQSQNRTLDRHVEMIMRRLMLRYPKRIKFRAETDWRVGRKDD